MDDLELNWYQDFVTRVHGAAALGYAVVCDAEKAYLHKVKDTPYGRKITVPTDASFTSIEDAYLFLESCVCADLLGTLRDVAQRYPIAVKAKS